MFGIGMPELILIFLLALLLFGASKLPELAKAMGKSFNAFKKGLKETEEEIKGLADEDEKKGKDTTKKS